MSRIAAQRVGISAERLMNGDIDILTAERLILAADESGQWPLDIYDCRHTSLRLLGAKTRMLLQHAPTCLVVLDHLLVANAEEQGQGAKRGNSAQDAASVTAAANAQREIAGEFKLPFLLLTQMSRPPRDNRLRRPTMQDLKFGGEEPADMVLSCIGVSFSWRPSRATRRSGRRTRTMQTFAAPISRRLGAGAGRSGDHRRQGPHARARHWQDAVSRGADVVRGIL